MSSRIRMAVVGCGGIAGAHVSGIESIAETKLVAAVDPDPEARRRAAREWSVPAFEGVGQMLAAMDVDGACLCTPPSTHHPLAASLLKRGVHVLCEKPLAPTSGEAEAMSELARREGRVLAVSSKFRHVDDLAEARARVDDGAIGRPLLYDVQFCARVEMGQRWNVQPGLSGGGVLMDNGCHALDVLDQLSDSPFARLTAVFPDPVVSDGVEDTAVILLQTEAGSVARITLSWSYFTKDLDFAVVQGTEGCIRVGWTGGQLRRHGESEWTPFGGGYDKIPAFESLLRSFATAIEDGQVTDLAMPGVVSVALIEQAYAAASEGSWSEVRSVVA